MELHHDVVVSRGHSVVVQVSLAVLQSELLQCADLIKDVVQPEAVVNLLGGQSA